MQTQGQTTSVLIVGDDLDTASFLESSLSALGFELARATNGTEALQHLRAHHFDVIISEITMPKMGGEELYRELEKNLPWAVPHICFIAADSHVYGAEAFLRETDVRYVEKPFCFDQIAGLINDILTETQS